MTKEELEKENAELEAKNEANENGAKKYAEYYFKTNDQLTKAKKYISFLLGVVHIKNTYNKEIEEEIAKAEAFFKEIKEKCTRLNQIG